MADPGNSTACPACTCPDPSDSSLSVAGNILGIVTFVTTTIAIVYSYLVVVTGFSKNQSELLRNLANKAEDLTALAARGNSLLAENNTGNTLLRLNEFKHEMKAAGEYLYGFENLWMRYGDKRRGKTNIRRKVQDIFKAAVGISMLDVVFLLSFAITNFVRGYRNFWDFLSVLSLRKFRFINSEESKSILTKAETSIQNARNLLSDAESSIALRYHRNQASELESVRKENAEIRGFLKEMSDQFKLLRPGIHQCQDGHDGEGARESIPRESRHERNRASSV